MADCSWPSARARRSCLRFRRRPSARSCAAALETLPMVNARKITDDRLPCRMDVCLVSSRSGERDRILVVQAGKTTLPAGGRGRRNPSSRNRGRTPTPPYDGRANRRRISPSSIQRMDVSCAASRRRRRRYRRLGASPDGRTLYYAASGSMWALPATGGTPIEDHRRRFVHSRSRHR